MHFYKLDETAGTDAGRLGHGGRRGQRDAGQPRQGRLDRRPASRSTPTRYADSLTGAHVQLPDDITAGMTELSVDYDIRIDPANVGDHHLWSFGRKTSCDATANSAYAGSIFGSNTGRLRTGLSATTPTTGASVQRSATYGLREGVWKHLTLHAAAQRERHDAGPGSCTRTASRSAATPT